MHQPPHDATVHELIRIARVCDLQNNPSCPERLRTVIAIADDQKRMPTAEELASFCDWSGASNDAIQLLISRASDYVNRSKARLTEDHPEYFVPGGALHPQERAETCWRDCWNFLRVTIYATALNIPTCTNPECIAAVRRLYTLMNVPIPGMQLALSTMASVASAELISKGHHQESNCLKTTITHLQSSLNKD